MQGFLITRVFAPLLQVSIYRRISYSIFNKDGKIKFTLKFFLERFEGDQKKF